MATAAALPRRSSGPGALDTHILDGNKTWEMRGYRCSRRDRIALACSGTGLLYGEVDIVDCLRVGGLDAGGTLVANGRHEDFMMLPQNLPKHGLSINNVRAFGYKQWWAWVLSSPRRYDEPIPYNHRRGAVNWVKLHSTPAVEDQEPPLKRPCRRRSPAIRHRSLSLCRCSWSFTTERT